MITRCVAKESYRMKKFRILGNEESLRNLKIDDGHSIMPSVCSKNKHLAIAQENLAK